MNTKGHIRYRTADREVVVGVTTVTSLIAKPALIKWSNNLGLDGIDSSKYADDDALIGTLAHAMITDGLKGRETDVSDYDANQQEAARWCVRSWDSWLRGRQLKPILVEAPLVSEEFRYGGTCDIYADIDGKLTLVDLKTGSNIWPEHHIQVSAYERLLAEASHKVDVVRILNIPRSRTEVFQEVVLLDDVLELNFEIFTHLLRIYEIRKEFKYG